MFTGIIEEVGKIEKTGSTLYVRAKKVLEGTKIGDSIAVNGVCLTVTNMSGEGFCADVMPETLRRSNLGLLKRGDKVNLERAMAADGRFGGHIVSGHIDGTGKIKSKKRDVNAVVFDIECSKAIASATVEKGSVAIDGISLTVVSVRADGFSVSVIPHTLENTVLSFKKAGDGVNIENDVYGKYVKQKAGGGLTEELLARCGFM